MSACRAAATHRSLGRATPLGARLEPLLRGAYTLASEPRFAGTARRGDRSREVIWVSKRVAVVGAGPSGLVTVKELLEEGHAPTCFEKAADPGGVFRFGETDGVVWESCRLTSSGPMTAFSDYPVLPHQTDHLLAGEYRDYLVRYAEAFGASPHLRLGTAVESVRPGPGGGWIVRSVANDGATREEPFDAVAVCSGSHQHPHLPRYPGQPEFPGTIIHASAYRRPEEIRGKRVLVVGGGESGGDIAAEVSGSAAETVLSLRRGVAVLPWWTRGRPNDYLTSRINNSAAHWVSQTRNPADRWKRRVYRWVFLPLVVVDKCVQTAVTVGYELLPLLDPRRLLAGRAGLAEVRTRFRMRAVIRDLLRESGGTVAEQFGTKRDAFVRAIATGRCRRAGSIARFDGHRVVFEDGSTFEPEVVIFCTGFDRRVPFIDERLARGPRFLHLINPAVGANLGFVGFVRPAYGAIPPLAELQARYFALLQSGKLALPPEAEMRRSIDQLTRFRGHYFRAVQGRLDYLVDYTSFSDDLAERIGCKPSLTALRRESSAFRRRFFAAPFVAAQYRLVGPHAKPAIARTVIAGLPITHPAPMVALYYLRWTLSRLLHRWLGPEFAPKLGLDLGPATAP